MGIPGIGRAPWVWVSHTEPGEPTELGIARSGLQRQDSTNSKSSGARRHTRFAEHRNGDTNGTTLQVLLVRYPVKPYIKQAYKLP